MTKKYKVVLTSSFTKGMKQAKKRHKDLTKIYKVSDEIASGKELDAKYKDHMLYNTSKYIGCRECHIEPDWLLIYKINNHELILLLVDTGTHSDLF